MGTKVPVSKLRRRTLNKSKVSWFFKNLVKIKTLGYFAPNKKSTVLYGGKNIRSERSGV